MPDLDSLVGRWGYPAIFLVVILGNVGLPVPEESILGVAGYLVWQGKFRFPAVVAVGIAAAALGDNVAFWLGRRYGQRALSRWVASPKRLEWMRGFVLRYGMLAVFVARFVAGLRFMAGPLAGTTGLSPARFFAANLLGALLYVPAAVGAGYAVGYGLGAQIERFRRVAGDLVVVAIVLAAVGLWIALSVRARRRA
jgi:undecaprenyl-diphosphatase